MSKCNPQDNEKVLDIDIKSYNTSQYNRYLC